MPRRLNSKPWPENSAYEIEAPRKLKELCQRLGIAEHVRFIGKRVVEDIYRDYLLAADVAVQLRTHRLGGLSGALLDCIAVGLPTVANADLANAMEAPTYVSGVADSLSPVLIANALVDLIERFHGRERPNEERLVFSESHDFRTYALRLCEALALDVPPKSIAS